MNQLHLEVLEDLLNYRRKVKLAIAMKRHPLKQAVWSMFADMELIKLMWSSQDHLNAELECVAFEVDLLLESIDLGFQYNVVEK